VPEIRHKLFRAMAVPPAEVCGARGQASQACTREAPGPRSGGTTAAPRGASLDWDWRQCLVPGNAGLGTEIAAMERREAPAFLKRECGKTKLRTRLAALHSPHFLCEGREEGRRRTRRRKEYGR